jgi:riboflavin kinase/FMN adenylyltransferase
LTWTERKVQLLGELGVDTVIAYPTDEALLALTPQEFFDRLIGQQLAARAIVEGPNFFFGHNRAGNIETLRALTTAAGMALEIVEPIMLDGDIVSSSRVRSLIASGQIDAACRLLTRPYRLRGMVTHGAGRGRGLGFPTANVDAVDTLLPGIGVYAGIAHVQGVAWPAAINIGPNPTFGEHAQKLEVHLIGFHDSLYGEPLEVDFLARLRDIHPFADVSALKAQLARDLATAQQIATETKTD